MNNKPVWVADSETDPFDIGVIPQPFIWGIYTGTDYREFLGSGPAYTCTTLDIDVMVDWLAEQDVILYAHNGGKFDWHFLSHRFDPESDLLVIHGRLSRFTIGKCEFRDSYNLMPVALEQYQKQKFDYTKMLREHRANHLPEIQDYLKSDCVNLWNMLDGFNKSYGLHITQATAAMHYWQKVLKNNVPRSGPGFFDHFKPFYFGGRVQCFEQGDFCIESQSIDINSAYPNAMLYPHPYSLDYETRDGTPARDFDKWGPLFFTVECKARGCFPYRATNGSLYFPDDGKTRFYHVTGWELMAAIDTATVDELKILEHTYFAETRTFSQYVNYFWDLRKHYKKTGDKGADFYCKIFLNALYGKFASDPRKYKNYKLYPSAELASVMENLGEKDTFQQFREWLIVSEHRHGSAKGRFYNIATAASITGYVRAQLWRGVCDSDRPLYCDTDSITAVGFNDGFTLSDELGDWQIEHEYDRVVIAGKKLYAMRKSGALTKDEKRWKIASKGARLEHDDIVRIAAGESVYYQSKVPTFSTSKQKPTHVNRNIRMTAADIRTVPAEIDPMLVS